MRAGSHRATKRDGPSNGRNRPLKHSKVSMHSSPVKFSSPEQEDIDEILLFLFRISHFMVFVLRVLGYTINAIFQATKNTLQWAIVVIAVLEIGCGFGPLILSSFTGSGRFAHIGGVLSAPYPTTSSPTPSQPSATEIAAAYFITDQIHHATKMLTLVEGMGLPSNVLFDEHIWNVERFIKKSRSDADDDDISSSISDISIGGLDTVLFNDFSAHGFIGKTLSHALAEIQHASSQTTLRYPPPRAPTRDAHLTSVLSLTSSNLLLEYSSALLLTERVLPVIDSAYLFLASAVQKHDDMVDSEKGWRNRLRRKIPSGSNKRFAADLRSVRAFLDGLDTIRGNMRRLKTYLEWNTEQLSRPSLIANLATDKPRYGTLRPVDESAAALQTLFMRSEEAGKTRQLWTEYHYENGNDRIV
ncbi:hypothetical protein BJ138DRAFT_1127738 [Hygrophoropsis aurantiaca]|uniref:Uncharacterized protein n=1 Tax=Hygrophoropsis aurantiaca TaxID=72124 RepID=A0ACB8A816_9AGAM|nr:hypothetical protein BJ138DRAFT_1127738 [Hygrophoropsis aurantiaca]